MMELSKDQMMAVNAGIVNPNMSWDVVEMPTWPFEIPDWAIDFDVDWMEQYANRPHFKVMTKGNAHAGDFLYEYVDGLYIAKLDDRLHWHKHGPLSFQTINGKFIEWGKLPDGRPDYNKRICEKREAWVTCQEEGYGGRHFEIKMKDGRDAILRGPWHVGTPVGYQEIYTYDIEDRARWSGGWPPKKLTKQQVERSTKWGRKPRWDFTGCFGLAVTDNLICRLLARYQPHLRLARVRMYGHEYIEPRFAGQPPKGMQIEGQDLSKD